MRRPLKIVGALVAGGLLLVAGFIGWASVASARILAESYTAHDVDFAVPFESSAAANASAIERGRHLLEARYACRDCHGRDLGGGTMVDAFPLGTILGPNLTSGAGSAITGFTVADWDRIVRHGINSDGTPSMMPSMDFAEMSDQELADIIAFVGSVPPVAGAVPAPTLGPVGRVLMATGQFPLAADQLAARTQHLSVPPVAEVSPDFGRHLAATCTGCHGATLAGGPIVAGDPSWGEAANLTLHAEGLGEWELEDFVTAMREGVGPDGVEFLIPMSFMRNVTQHMTDVEIEAVWVYLQSLEPLPTGG